jgi:hypothetical protein
MFKFLRKPNPNGYVIDQFSLSVSLFPKTGSTTFKYFLYEAEHGQAFERANTDIHKWARKNRIAPVKDCKYRLILIRDPIERFISCYNNKVLQARHLDNMEIGPLSLSKAEREFPYPSFDEFVDNFPEIRKVPVINHHTKPISEFLGTRGLDVFSEVFTFDQMDNLAERINQITDANVALSHRQNSTNNDWDKALKRADLSSLTPSQFNYLTRLYSAEYRFLNPYYCENRILKKWQQKREETR